MPFFAQDRYQCGPAALATVLSYSGADVTPADLLPLVYVPERKGSFQAELKAATRESGRLPYELDPTFDALLAELAGGSPVLVLQNLGLGWWPKWHYAVVIGYEPDKDRLLLRSGQQERRVERAGLFLRSWGLAGNWAMVAVRPGQLPATASPGRYLEMLAASEGRLNAAAMSRALDAGLAAWPGDPNLLFAAGNQARAEGHLRQAAEDYRSALSLQPGHVGALNNYADLLREQFCLAAASEQIAVARGLIDPDSALYPAVATTAREIAAMIDERGPVNYGST